MALDVFIVNYHSENETVNCVRSILATSLSRYSPSFHIADNGSSVDWTLLGMPPQVSVYRNPSNLGFGKAVNNLCRRTQAPLFIVVNPDSLFLEGPWSELLSFMEEHPTVGILGPKILNGDGSVQGSARSFPSLSTVLFGRTSPLTRRFPRNRFSRKNIVNLERDDLGPRVVDWVSGACMIIRRAAFQSVSGFDEGFFLFWEDADLCARMKNAGWQTVYHPASSVIHYVGVSRRHQRLSAHTHFHRSAFRLFCKHHPQCSGVLAPFVALGLAAHFSVSLLWDRRL